MGSTKFWFRPGKTPILKKAEKKKEETKDE
jgi:hypothetical protein